MPSLSHPPLPQPGLLRTFRIGVKLGHARTWVWEKIVCGGRGGVVPPSHLSIVIWKPMTEISCPLSLFQEL